MNRSLTSFESHDEEGRPIHPPLRRRRGRERDGGGELPGPIGPVAPEGQQALSGRSQLRGPRVHARSFRSTTSGNTAGSTNRSTPTSRAASAAAARRWKPRRHRPHRPRTRPSPEGEGRALFGPGTASRIRVVCLIQGRRDTRRCRQGTAPPERECRCRTKQDTLPRCEKGIARTASGPCSCTRSPLAAPCVTVRWKSTGCGRSPSRWSPSGTRPGRRDAILGRR